jgi:hypothetical protein
MSFLFLKRIFDGMIKKIGSVSAVAGLSVFLLAGATAEGADYWNYQGGPDGGRSASLAVDPSNVDYAYTTNSNGLYKTLDGGNHWVNVNPYWGRNAVVVIDPVSPNIIYMYSQFILKSTDWGSHWSTLDTKTPCTDIIKAFILDPKNPSSMFVILTSASGAKADYYVIKSFDSGNSWLRMSWNAYTLSVDSTNDNILYASTSAGMQKTVDGGLNWISAQLGLPQTSDLGTVVVDSRNPNNLYVTVGGTSIYKSTNGGAVWLISNNGLTAANNLKDPIIDPSNSNSLYLVGNSTTTGTGVVFQTLNAGKQWQALNPGPAGTSFNSVVMSASSPTVLFAGTNSGGVLKSLNNGVEWLVKISGLKAQVSQMVLDSARKNHLYLGGNGVGVYQSGDSGITWFASNNGLPNLEVQALAISGVDPRVLFVSLNNARVSDQGGVRVSLPAIYKSTDSGLSWTLCANPSDNFGLAAPRLLVTDPTDVNGLFAVSASSGVYHTSNLGAAWTFSKTGLPDNTQINSLVVDSKTSATVYAGVSAGSLTSGLVYKSFDGGNNWYVAGAGLPNAAGVLDLVIDPKTPTTLYAAVAGTGSVKGGIYKSTDGGGSWVDANRGIATFDFANFYSTYYNASEYGSRPGSCGTQSYYQTATLLAVDPLSPSTLFSVVDGVVFRSTDGASGWKLAHSGLISEPNKITVSPVDSATVFAANQGVFSFNPSGGSGGNDASITVTSPNGGESWVVGTIHYITWNSTGLIDRVNVDLSVDGGFTYSKLFKSIPNDGRYPWIVPINVTGASCRIRVSDATGTTSDISNGNFTVAIASPCIFTLDSNSALFDIGGGPGSIKLETLSGCAWTAVSNVGWITLTSGDEGIGPTSIKYFVAANTTPSFRVGIIMVGDQLLTVTQSAGTGIGGSLFVPIVLSSTGLGGSFYTTELTLTNRGTTPALVNYYYTGALDLGGGSGVVTVLLAPGQTVVPDAISYLKNLGLAIPDTGNRGGTLRIELSNLSEEGIVTITSRTTTLVKDPDGALIGRAGLAYAATPISQTLSAVAYICGLRQNSNDRSNLALQNAGLAGDGVIVLRVTVYDGNSSFSKVLPQIALNPGGFYQIAGILTSNGLSLSNGYVKVERLSGTAPYYAYGVINDQLNSDGSFVPPQTVSTNPVKGLTVPVILQTNSFLSELILTNYTAQNRSINFKFVAETIFTPDKTARFSIALPAGQQLIIPDIVAYMRDNGVPGIVLPGDTVVGALFATPASGDLNGIVLGARTSSPGGNAGGRFGLFYTAVPYGAASSESAWLYGLQQNSENRTNLAIVNTGETDSSSDTFLIDLYDGETGALVTSIYPVTVTAQGWTQLGSVLAAAPIIQQGFAHVQRASGTNPFITYAVINDGASPGLRTGDGAYLLSHNK